MAQRITVNQTKGTRGSGVLVCVANTTGFLSTSASAPAVNKANTAGETISAMYISEIQWSGEAYEPGGSSSVIVFKRGANTVWTSYGENGHADFKNSQMRLEQNALEASANIVFETTGNINFILKVTKNSGE